LKTTKKMGTLILLLLAFACIRCRSMETDPTANKVTDTPRANQVDSPRFPMLLNMVHHNPGEPPFLTRYDQPGYLKELGYTGQIPKIHIQCGLTYDKAFPGILPDPGQERMWIERHAYSVRMLMENARKQAMPLYPFTDMLVIPKSLMDKLADKMQVNGRLSILSETTQNVVRAQIEEIFRRYPDLAGITIRHGETYLHDTPYHTGTSPVKTPQEHTVLINILREEICVKRNKILIYRTWDFGRMHTNAEFYLDATEKVAPHPNLFFSTKHVNDDFVRGEKFNTTFGRGKHQRIMEISVNQAGLYGRSSHPYYMAKGIIEGWKEMENPLGLRDFLDDKTLCGIWIWCWGDGWFGPYFNNELWINLNEYVIRNYAKNPGKSEEFYFNEFAHTALGLDTEAAMNFRKMLMLATDASYLGQQSQICRVNPWWCRDHYLAAVDVDDIVKTGKIKEALAEKAHAVDMWKQAEALASSITLKDHRDTDFMRVSTTYGRIKYQIFEQIWRIQLMLADERINNTELDNQAASQAVTAYETAFNQWRTLKYDNVCCPTLYTDCQAQWCNAPPFQEVLQPLKKRLAMN